MEITFLGGGNEIGASSAIVELGSNRILVDCGIRMSGDDVLPDLAAITRNQFSHLDAVILTHAHMDHSGALPVLHQHFPNVPIYCTAPTRGLVEVLQRDSLNIMRSRAESEREIPLYQKPAVESLLDKLIPVPFGSPTQIGRSGMTVTWFPAGHILGAASVGIQGIEAGRTLRVLFSGDISVADQITVPGMLAPAGFRPEVLIIESTYGDRMHAARALEEQRLVEMVAAIIERNGKLLIPAFAIGRAQEVILTLLRQFRNKRLGSFPVYIDGMVRSVCGVYTNFPAYQTPYSRKLIEQHGNPFFNVVDEIQAVTAPTDREKILAGPPCCIIASSGMMTGGASAFYGQTIVTDERNGLAITGYQDEESPGRQLLDLAAGQSNHVNIGGKSVEVKCSVSKYALSAHADANEIASLVNAINPRHVVLVHGEGSARPALAELLRRSSAKKRPIHLPRTGDTLRFGGGKRAVKSMRSLEQFASAQGEGAALSQEGLESLADRLRQTEDKERPHSPTELLDQWYGAHNWGEEQYAMMIALLDKSRDFRQHPTRPHLYRLRFSRDEDEKARTVLFPDPNDVIKQLDQTLGPNSGLYHKGYDTARHKFFLTFDFPLVAREKYREQLAQIVKETGWTIEITNSTHQGRLAAVAKELLPTGLVLVREPAIHLDSKDVVVTVTSLPESKAAEAAARQFKEITGFSLGFKVPGVAAPAPSSANAPVFVPEGMAPLEINQSYQAIEKEFEDATELWRPYRKSLKSDGTQQFIELAFVTAEVGLRQQEKISQLAKRIGWPLRIKTEPNQLKLIELATSMTPKEWHMQKQPSIHRAETMVRIKCLNAPPREDKRWEELREEFQRLTGWNIGDNP